MASSRSVSIASAQRAEISLASTANSPPASSDCDIDFPVALDHVELLQLDALVRDMDAVGEMKLVAVPGTDDVHVVAVKGLAVIDAVPVNHLLHLRHHPTPPLPPAP